MTSKSLTLLSGAFCLSLVLSACNPAALAELPGIVTQLLTDKNTVESFVQDLKKNVDSNTKGYSSVERKYEDARAAYDGYLDAVKLAVLNNQPKTNLAFLTENVRTKTARFLAEATKDLAPTVDTRGVQFEKAINPPTSLHTQICKLPKQYRATALQQLEDQLRWKSWDQF